MRIFSFLFCLPLLACDAGVNGGGEAVRKEIGGLQIQCMLDGSTEFSQTCELKQSKGTLGPMLSVSGPSGGFRRLLITQDGRGVVAADGAEAALVTPRGVGVVEVAIGRDRYLLPATIKPAMNTPRP